MSDDLNPVKLYAKAHPIECIFFSEFHHKQGPRITYQYPDNVLMKNGELLDAVLNYIIPKPDLKEKLITTNAVGKKVIACPICIDDDSYIRNQYIFNFGVIVDNVHKSSPCIPMIKKLSRYMTELEKESYFVSNEETRSQIPGILKSLFEEINAEGQCMVSVNQSTTLFLKLFPPSVKPPVVNNHDVPILLLPRKEFNSAERDLTTQQILHFIDGFNHVQKIATLADVDLELTRICIQNLAFYNYVHLISIFQYSNVYMTTTKLTGIVEDPHLQAQCLQYVAQKGNNLPSLHDVMILYCGLHPGVTVKDLCIRHQEQTSRINEQKLIQFGLIHGLIRRINMYPVRPDSKWQPQSLSHKRYTIGQFSAEEICCKFGMSRSELVTRLENDSNIVTCWK